MSPLTTDSLFVWRLFLLILLSIVIAIWGIFKAPLHALGNADTQRDAYFLDQAGLVFSLDPHLSAEQIWQHKEKETVTLPNSWSLTQKNFDGQGWYQIEFQLDPEKPTPNALFMPKAIMNAHAYLNGHWIGGHGAMDQETSRHWNRPYLFQFPPALLNAQDNVLHIQVASYENQRGGLGRMWLGTSEQLEPLYDSSHRWQVTGSMLATFVAWGSGFLLLLFSRIFREREGFFFLGLAILVFAVRNTAYFLDWTHVPNAQLTQTLHSLHAWFACFYSLFLIKYMNLNWANMRKALWIYAAFVSLLAMAMNSQTIPGFNLWLLLPLIPIALALNIMLLRYSWKNRNFEAAILACSALLFVILSLRDLCIKEGLLPLESVLLSQYTGILLFIAASWIIFRRYSLLLGKLKTANNALNTELAVREQQLFHQFNLLHKVEQQRTKDEERRRIMQDIHDGVGSSLVSALNLSETRPLDQLEMRDVLQECLDDLRMAIDSLDPQSDDLLALLGNFRWRYERRLKACGVTLSWSVTEIPKLEGYTSRDLFDLLRIVQEVFANSLKHAKATKIELCVRWDNIHDKVQLNISDNGVGMPANMLPRGRGLAHMKIRAKSICIDLYTGNNSNRQGVGVDMSIPRLRMR